MSEISALAAAVREVRDAANDVVRPGGWESADILDGVVARHLTTIGESYDFAQRHLGELRGIVWQKCDIWQKARAQIIAAPMVEPLRLAAHQDAEDLMAHCDSLLSALQAPRA
jgi:hypothetical protein